MKYNELNVVAHRKSNRVGRGIAAGQGKTAGRGTKGQNARSGVSRKKSFEGGQNPLFKRIPKLRGFTRIKDKPTTVTTGQLSKFKGIVDNLTLYEAKITGHPSTVVRVVVRGELTNKVEVRLQGASATAIEKIKKAGGNFTKVDRVKAAGKVSDEKQL